MTAVGITLRIAIGALVIKRFAQDARGVRRGQVPRTRLIIPAAILIAGALLLTGVVSITATAAILVAVDVGFVILCYSIVRSARSASDAPIDDRLAQTLDRFFPEWFGRFAATDLMLLLYARRGLQEVINPSPPTPLTYTYGSNIGLAGVIISIAVIPDAVLFWLLIPHHYWFIALFLDALDVWACLWLFGALGVMAARPHSIDGQRLVLRNGIFQRAELQVDSVVGSEILGVRTRRQLPRSLRRDAAILSAGGVPLVHLTLNADAHATSIFRLQPRAVRDIVVASDDPKGLVALITAAKSDTPLPAYRS